MKNKEIQQENRVSQKSQDSIKICKSIVGVATFIISIIGVICSIHAIKIAKKAINVSEDQFLKLNRPYILVEPRKIDDTNDYVKISRYENKIRYRMSYVLKNVGTAPAAYIRVPQSGFTESNIPIIDLQPPPQLPLAPNDKAAMGFMIEIPCNTEELAQEKLSSFRDPNWPGITLEIPINYDNGLDFRQMYVTTVRMEFRRKEAQVLKEDFKTYNKIIESGKVKI